MSRRSPRILYVQYTNPAGYPPLQHSARLLAREGWDVMFLGTHALGARALEFVPHPSIQVQRLPYCPPGWRQKLHYLRFTLRTARWAARWRPDWIYLSDVMSAPAGRLLRQATRARLIYHEHDSPTDAEPSASPENHSDAGRFRRFVLRSRAQVARHAECCVLPNAGRVARFREQTQPRGDVHCVWNCPSLEEIGETPPPAAQSRVLYYHGNISPQLLPLTIVEALTRLPEFVSLQAVGYVTAGHRGYDEQLLQHAQRLGVAGRVTIRPALPRQELLRQARGGWVGLAAMPLRSDNLNFRHMVGASNKAFDYLACGLALLVSDLPDWRQTFANPGYGLACNPTDPASVASALAWCLEHPAETRRMAERGHERLRQDWNYEAQFAPVRRRLRQEHPPAA